MPGFELIGEEERAALNELMDEGGVLFAHGFGPMRKTLSCSGIRSSVS